MDPSREAAYTILLNMEKEGSYSNLQIKKTLENNPDASPDLVRRLVYGVTEKRIYLDYYLDKLLSQGVKSLKPGLLTLLRLGAYQLEFMDGVPDYAAISSSVELCKKHIKGMDKLTNGVLRGWQRKNNKGISLPSKNENSTDYYSVMYSCHPSIIELIEKQYGESRVEAILKSNHEKKPLAVRINRIRAGNTDIKDALTKEGFVTLESKLSNRVLLIEKDTNKDVEITETDLYKQGAISIQSQESCFIADEVEPGEGERILDLCAAPGGKTFAMAESMKNQGIVDAFDVYPHRVSLIEEGKKRLGLDIVHARVLDGRMVGNEKEEYYHRVLIDAPCSGLGVMRKKPEIKYKDFSLGIDELLKLQSELLESGAKALRKGGRLVYSTCTINYDENKGIVEDFLKSNKNYHLLRERQLMPDIDGYDGFYVAVIDKEQ